MAFAPTALSFNSYGWKGGQAYNADDIPIVNSSSVDRTVLEQRFAYEWFDQSGRYASGRNPPFASRAAGRLLPSLTESGSPPRILRGFIRRAEYDSADHKSKARLYFMYNPDQITRDYVSYLDQGALDPFNTVFQSGNLVPPPSFMDFSFSLMFDRQDEATDSRHPGVFVDYEYFDLVVRNVEPVLDPNNSNTSTLPDNGVMMVNPRDITVVFSPQITVQGRPLNARVSFQKFTHRMTPTRMQIDLTMRVTYFGPMKDMVEYKREEEVAAQAVAWDISIPSPFTITREQIEEGGQLFSEKMTEGLLTPEQITLLIDAAEAINGLAPGTENRFDTSILANEGLNASIVEYALSKCTDSDGPPIYDNSNNRNKLWSRADCSSFVWGAFADHKPPYNEQMGADWAVSFAAGTSGRAGILDSATMVNTFRKAIAPAHKVFSTDSKSSSGRRTAIEPNLPSLLKGDVLLRLRGITGDAHGHVAFVYSNNPGAKTVEIVDAAGKNMVGKRSLSYTYLWEHYTDGWRPLLGTPNSVDARATPAAGAT